MFRKIQYAFEDYVLYPLGDFFARINIYGRMRDAEWAQAQLCFENRILNATLWHGAGEHTVACRALEEIAQVVEGVNSPNGTTRKIGRIVTDVLNRLETGPEDVVEETGDLFTAANDAEEAKVAA